MVVIILSKKSNQMCLILFALNKNPDYKIIIAANRDEFFNRPTISAGYWKENNAVLGGRDIKSGGTWIGINKTGRFIAITNYRDPKNENSNAKSRGDLSKRFLFQSESVSDFIKDISKSRSIYNGFNLLLSDDAFNSLYHYSNISNRKTKIKNGIHGLSNHLIDTPWPKIATGKTELSKIAASKSIKLDDLVEMLKSDKKASDELLPNTGISYDLEKKLSSVFISMNGYGTRCSTIILVDKENNISFLEVSYNEKKQVIDYKKYNFELTP